MLGLTHACATTVPMDEEREQKKKKKLNKQFGIPKKEM